MLSRKEIERIDREIAIVPQRRSACIEALSVVQSHRGWVSDEAIRDVADYLGMSAEEVDGVATFYNLLFRRPVGRHVIHICDSVSCWIMGCDEVRCALSSRLGVRMGETSADGKFTLLTIPCLGHCEHAPVLMIDRDMHVDVSPQTVEPILEEYE